MIRRAAALLALALCMPAARPLVAQDYFGQNQVQYARFDWHVLETEHFLIYYYPAERAATNGRVDLVYYDRSCDPSGDKLNCVTLSSWTDASGTWTTTPVTTTGFDGDTFGVCLEDASGDPCTSTDSFLGDYIAVASNDDKAQVMWTGNGDHTLDVFTAAVTP